MQDYKKIESCGYECRVDNVTTAMYIKRLSATTFIEATYSKDKDDWRLMLFVQDNPGSKNNPLFIGVHHCEAKNFDAVTDEMKSWLSTNFSNILSVL